MATESYEDYARKLQDALVQAAGVTFTHANAIALVAWLTVSAGPPENPLNYPFSSGSARTSGYRPPLVDVIVTEFRRTGADPVIGVATSMQESGLSWTSVGDNGTSFGPFQHHKGGALGSHSVAWAESPAAVIERAHAFIGVHDGTGAANVQKPANKGAYAAAVNANIPKAKALVAASPGHYSLGPVSSDTSTSAPSDVFGAMVTNLREKHSGLSAALRKGGSAITVAAQIDSIDWATHGVTAEIALVSADYNHYATQTTGSQDEAGATSPADGLNNIVGGVGTGLESLGQAAGFLLNPSSWIRIIQIVGGFAIGAAGIYIIVKET